MSVAGTGIEPRRGSELSDEAIVNRVRDGERDLYEILIRRHNQRIYRIARSILRDELEAEDVMQDAYVRAYAHLSQFEGRASFRTWISRIAVHEALARVKRNGRYVEWDDRVGSEQDALAASAPSRSPEEEVSRLELASILTASIESIPASHRIVFVLRQLEGMTTEEVAECLGISADNVKVRLHRAKVALRKQIVRRFGREAPEILAFHLSRCDRVVSGVLARLAGAASAASTAASSQEKAEGAGEGDPLRASRELAADEVLVEPLRMGR